MTDLAMLNISERCELEAFRRRDRVQDAAAAEATLTTCIICDESNCPGITCSNSDEHSAHYVCDACLTLFVRTLNEDIGTTALLQRQGLVLCPGMSPERCSCLFPSGVLCQHITDPAVIDDYVRGISEFQKVTLVHDYTAQILQNFEEVSDRCQSFHICSALVLAYRTWYTVHCYLNMLLQIINVCMVNMTHTP